MRCACSHEGRDHVVYEPGDSEMAGCAACGCRGYQPVVSLDGILAFGLIVLLCLVGAFIIVGFMSAYR